MTRYRDTAGLLVEVTPAGFHVRYADGTDLTSVRNRVPRPSTVEGLAALGVDLDSLTPVA